ncbi:endonuclease/exonuclease/phosphatase family protein [Paeniglutamicibacter cryotolerans]|uniref:Vancomycin resistance protein VanJ n=1 Tax=Paeniglutamicibacter cryotolerans TaxID=670079 RepID=A0A839QJZ9_9MICC|nr:endonuclease/exonuclease/phosphatase family protein [Paeniglutamicibacter cryotolerans]MBB2995074.1 vancomycin resistance protein VanJ [Paeniglutamicibacter cryotolerans]
MPTTDAPDTQRRRRRPSRARRLLRTLVLLGSLLTAALISFHSSVPDVAGLGLLVDSAAPWLGLAMVPLLALALLTRSAMAPAFVLIPALAWAAAFGSAVIPLSWSAPEPTAGALGIASQNVKSGSGTALESARTLSATGADLIALQELDPGADGPVTAGLSADYPYHFVVGTVGLWSRYPLHSPVALDLGLGWKRALSARVTTDAGEVKIYVVHAASARPNDHADRDEMLFQLSTAIKADAASRVIAVGDFNATAYDRAFAPLLRTLDEPRQNAGGLGFTWRADPLPVMRLDHFLSRGLPVTSNTVLPAGKSDHLAVRTNVNLLAGS